MSRAASFSTAAAQQKHGHGLQQNLMLSLHQSEVPPPSE